MKKLISTKNNYSEAVARRCSVRKGVPRNFANFTRKQLCQSLFFNKVADLRPATLLKKRPWHRCFFSEFCEISNNTFFTEYLLATASDYFYSNFGKIQNICKWICESTIWSSSVPAYNYNLQSKPWIETDYFSCPGTPRNLKKTFCISKKCNKGDITG